MLHKCLLNEWKILQKDHSIKIWKMICGGLIFEAGELDEEFVAVMAIGWMRKVAEGRERRAQVIITRGREFSRLGDQLFECRAA